MANEDKHRVDLVVTGTVGIAHLLEPTVVQGNESNETFDLNIKNPVVSVSKFHQQRHPELAQNAIASFQKRIRQGNEQYPEPSVFVSLPLRNLGADKDNTVRFFDMKTRQEFIPEGEFAIGTKIIAEVQTYDSKNNLTAPYDYRGQRLWFVYIEDKDTVQYYTGNTPEGFTPLPAGDSNTAPNVGSTGTATPSQPTQPAQTFGANTTPESPFTQGNVAPSEVNPTFGGQTAPNANPTGFGGQTTQNANPTGFGGQPTQPTQQAQPTQPAPAQPTQPQQPADPFGNQQAGQQPAQPQAAQPNGQNANPFGNQQADPFGQQNTQIDDSDLPF